MDCLGLWNITRRALALNAFSDDDDCYNGNAFTVVLDAVGMDEADIRQEYISVLIFVFGDIL